MLTAKTNLRIEALQSINKLINSNLLGGHACIRVGKLLLVLPVLILATRDVTIGRSTQQQTQSVPKQSAPKQAPPKQVIEPETVSIATVNGVEVSIERFNTLYKARTSKMRLSDGSIPQTIALSAKSAITNQLIDELLIEQESKRRA